MKDDVMAWVVCVLPRTVCVWIWDLDIHLGCWAPHILGRIIGSDARRVG